jgi:hypothetical protein
MNPGKITCEVLKKIRSEIAEANQIDYRSEPCSFKGACIGTCPKCESELQYLEHQLIKKQGSQKTALFAGVSLAIMSGFSACKQSDPPVQNSQTPSIKPQLETIKTEKTNTASNQETLPQNSKKENKKLKTPQETIQIVSLDTNKVVLSQMVDTTMYLSDTLKLDQVYFANNEINRKIYMVGGAIAMPIMSTYTAFYHPFYNSQRIYPNYSSAPYCFSSNEKFENYLNSLFTYPFNKNLNKKIIKLQILIDKTGKIKDVSVLKSIDQELDQQIVKIIKNMPDWNPGEDPNGRPTDTRVKLTLKVTPEKITVVRQTYDEVEITMDNK